MSRLLLLNSKQEEGRDPSEVTLGATLISCRTGSVGMAVAPLGNADGGPCSGFCLPSASSRLDTISHGTGAPELSLASRSSPLSFFGRGSIGAESLLMGGTFETCGGEENFCWFPAFSVACTGPGFEALTPALTLCGSGSSTFNA